MVAAESAIAATRPRVELAKASPAARMWSWPSPSTVTQTEPRSQRTMSPWRGASALHASPSFSSSAIGVREDLVQWVPGGAAQRLPLGDFALEEHARGVHG